VQRSEITLQSIPTILVVNKVDLVNDRGRLKWNLDEIQALANFSEIFYVSAKTGYNLSSLSDYFSDASVNRNWLYHS